MSDINATIRKNAEGNQTRPYCLGTWNERGSRLIQLCKENSLCVTNTLFKLMDRRMQYQKSNRLRTHQKTIQGICQCWRDYNPVHIGIEVKRYIKKKSEGASEKRST